MVLSSKNNSIVSVREGLSVRVSASPGSEARLLWLVAHHLLACIMLRGLSRGDKILVHDPTRIFASVIAEQAALLGVQVTFMTTKPEASGMQGTGWVAIHPAASISDPAVARLVHDNFSVFVNLTPHSEIGSIEHQIAFALPIYCRKEDIDLLWGKGAWTPQASHLVDIHSRLEKAVTWASATLTKVNAIQEHIPTVSLNTLPGSCDRLMPYTVLEWDAASEVSIRARPVDSLISFLDNKTYWLVGLTGGLGLSLCEWMVQRGARFVVISSRKPNVETAWLDEMRAKGVTIKVSAK